MPIRREPNQRRRAHRVDLPMVFEVGGRVFPVFDWSVTGLAARIPEKEAAGLDLEPGRVLPARLHIPMPGARVALDVRVRVVGRRGPERVAFSFVDLSPRNRRILRQVIELGIEGRLGDLEDTVALLAQPDLPTPLRDAMVLSDLEEEALATSFRRRAILSVVLGVGFLLFVAGLLFYNTVYRIEAEGVAMGQVRRVAAAATGELRALLVQPGERVAAGAPLFRLDDRELAVELARVERELALVRERFAALAATGEASPRIEPASVRHRARVGLFPVPLLAGGSSAATDRHGGEAAPADDVLARLLQQRARLEAERRRLRLRRERLVGRAPEAGRVVRVAAEVGDRVAAGRTVVLLEVDRPPVIVARVRDFQARRLHPGLIALVRTPGGESFEARLTAVGYGLVDPDFSATEEASLGEVLITLEPLDPTLRLPPYARVDVWIRTFTLFGS